jgi:hypothetical protein
MKEIAKKAVSGLRAIAQVHDVVHRMSSDSLSEYTTDARVEPPVIIEASLAGTKHVMDIANVAVVTYGAYYLQAWTLHTVQVNGVHVREILDGLNNKRSARTAAGGLLTRISQESGNIGLPFMDEQLNVSMEASTVPDITQRYVQERIDEMAAKDAEIGNGSVNNETIKMYSDSSADLSVGRILGVELRVGEKNVTIPVMIRLNSQVMNSSGVMAALSAGNMKTSFRDRLDGWRSGELEFVRDVVLCQDLIDKHRRNLRKDTSGYYKEVQKNRKIGGLASILSLTPSVAKAATICIITKDTANKLAQEYEGTMSDPATVDRIFVDNYVTMMFVVDEEWETVDIFERGSSKPRSKHFREMASLGKEKGIDPFEVMKAFQLGKGSNI